jgi:tetratricopeptide (TPR) repeat protein
MIRTLALFAALSLCAPVASAQVLGDRVEASGCAFSAGGNVTDNSINLICGMPFEEVAQMVVGMSSNDPAHKAEVLGILRARLPEDTRFRVEAVASFFETLGQEQVPPERLADTFADIANENLALRDRLRSFEGDDPAMQTLREAAAEALEIGDHDAAIAALREAEELIETEALEALLTERTRRRAELIAEQAEVERTRLDLAAAALLFDRAAGTVGPYDEAAALRHVESAARAWYEHGRDKGDNAALLSSIAHWQRLLVATSRDRTPLDWAMTQMNLGNALVRLGESEPGTARLEQAVTAYRAALEEATRDRVPLEWAMTQMNLGAALQALGKREPGTARLEEAIAAYRASLQERTRDRVPLDWATSQMNFGNALAILGERELGTGRLEQAVAAYRAALEEMTRDRVPLSWALVQMNLGAALRTLGEREPGTARLEEAVAAYRAALEEVTRDRVQLAWAMAQNNLGNALAILGEREPGTARLEEAVAAYRAALKERTRDRVPLEWAMTQMNLAFALETLSGRAANVKFMLEAAASFTAAAEVLEAIGHPVAQQAISGAERARAATLELEGREPE